MSSSTYHAAGWVQLSVSHTLKVLLATTVIFGAVSDRPKRCQEVFYSVKVSRHHGLFPVMGEKQRWKNPTRKEPFMSSPATRGNEWKEFLGSWYILCTFRGFTCFYIMGKCCGVSVPFQLLLTTTTQTIMLSGRIKAFFINVTGTLCKLELHFVASGTKASLTKPNPKVVGKPMYPAAGVEFF